MFVRLAPFILALGFSLPGVICATLGIHASAPITALVAGTAILSASFLLLWACDAAQKDMSQGLALGVLALVAVLPEYAVDMYFTWQAGRDPSSDYAHYAIANMTGANRLIVGVAWAAVAVLFWWKTRKAVQLTEERMLEIRFLAAATVYALIIPIKGSLAWYDGVFLIGLYVWYMVSASRRPRTEEEVEGPAAHIAALPQTKRRITTVAMFVVAAVIILLNAERFCEGLVGTGKAMGIDEFLLVQWLAPIASEAPEFVVAIVFTLRAKADLALGSLISSKLNQWTLLVGMIPGVFAVSSGSLHPPLPMNSLQLHEVLLTAAQSLLAVVILAKRKLSVGHGALLFGLFIAQLVLPGVIDKLPSGQIMGIHGESVHAVFSLFYVVASLTLLLDDPKRLSALAPWLKRRGS